MRAAISSAVKRESLSSLVVAVGPSWSTLAFVHSAYPISPLCTQAIFPLLETYGLFRYLCQFVAALRALRTRLLRKRTG